LRSAERGRCVAAVDGQVSECVGSVRMEQMRIFGTNPVDSWCVEREPGASHNVAVQTTKVTARATARATARTKARTKATATATATAREERLAFGRAVAPSARRLLAGLKPCPSGLSLLAELKLCASGWCLLAGLKPCPSGPSLLAELKPCASGSSLLAELKPCASTEKRGLFQHLLKPHADRKGDRVRDKWI